MKTQTKLVTMVLLTALASTMLAHAGDISAKRGETITTCEFPGDSDPQTCRISVQVNYPIYYYPNCTWVEFFFEDVISQIKDVHLSDINCFTSGLFKKKVNVELTVKMGDRPSFRYLRYPLNDKIGYTSHFDTRVLAGFAEDAITGIPPLRHKNCTAEHSGNNGSTPIYNVGCY